MKRLKDIPPIDKEQAIDDFIKGAKDEKINEGVISSDNTGPSPTPNTGTELKPNTTTVTVTDTSTVTLLDTLIKPYENYVRMISYVYEYQSQYVKKMAKKKKVKESEIVRIALDYFINNIESKEK